MTSGQDVAVVQCPSCWEPVEIVVDRSVARQTYVEDCPVCCRPMTLRIAVTGDEVEVEAERESE
jgi:hypothetical protein